jgi:hypothetical protein
MQFVVFAVMAVLVVFAGTSSAKADRTDDMAWASGTIAPDRSVRAERNGRAVSARAREADDMEWAWDESAVERPARAARKRGVVRAERRRRTPVASAATGSRGATVAAAEVGSYAAGPRPGKWCGWWMRTQRGGGPEFNVAWNWRNYGSPAVPQVGAVVIWRHHVGEIVGQAADGRWIVRSGNDGGRVRERARSVAGALFRI